MRIALIGYGEVGRRVVKLLKAFGCRILVSLLHEMVRRDAKKGLATLCIGGGQGVALAVERD